MQIDIQKQGNVAILHLQGSLDADSVNTFKKTTQELLEDGTRRMVFDCRTLDFVDSIGLGAMISLLRRIRSDGGDLKIAGLNAEVRSVFEITRLHRLFEIAPDWETACRTF